MNAREYLASIAPSREQVEDFINPEPLCDAERNNEGWTYDPDVGWVLKNSVRDDGIDGSKTFYHYEATGRRKVVNFPERTARIHTYGDSFTHCDQVSDGETWQEYLAGHLQEPVENYGVGGYGVWQAYQRMRKVEPDHPGEYIILNIWDDDNYRNLDSWRTIRFGSRYSCGFTLPYLKVDLEKDTVSEMPNCCPAAEDAFNLMDVDWLVAQFGEDDALANVLALKAAGEGKTTDADLVPVSFGLQTTGAGEAGERLREIHTRAAMRATIYTLGKTQGFAAEHGKKLMVILSYGYGTVKNRIEGRNPFDRELLDHLAGKEYPVVDIAECHCRDYARLGGDVDVYLKPFYNGHYAPAGNFFLASSIKDAVVEWLEPMPAPYA